MTIALLDDASKKKRIEGELRRAYRALNHAILYLGPDIEERIAVSTLELAKRQVYKEKFAITRYALWSHWCEKCPHYRDAPR